jgi:hypothetical protein
MYLMDVAKIVQPVEKRLVELTKEHMSLPAQEFPWSGKMRKMEQERFSREKERNMM